MLVIRGIVDGKMYWSTVVGMAEAHVLLAAMSKTYSKVKVWLEDLAGRIVLTFERLVDRMKIKLPARRSIWKAIGVVLNKVF